MQKKKKHTAIWEVLSMQTIWRPSHIQKGVEIAKGSQDHGSKPISLPSSQNIKS